MSMVFQIEVEEDSWKEIISFFRNLIDFEEESVDFNSIFFTQVFDISDMSIEVIEIGHILESILFENLLVSFLEKAFELEYEIVEDIFILMRLLEKRVDQVYEFIGSYRRVDEPSNLISYHILESGSYFFNCNIFRKMRQI